MPFKIWVKKGNEFKFIFLSGCLEQLTLKCVQRGLKENLLLLKDLLEFWKMRFTSIWQLLQEMFI